MKAYSVFSDFSPAAEEILNNSGIELVKGENDAAANFSENLSDLIRKYDALVIGTSQKISSDILSRIDKRLIIGTISSGTDHISIPEFKQNSIRIVNAPTANAQSVSEHVFAMILSFIKRLNEGIGLYRNGKDKKCLKRKSTELASYSIGVLGAGEIGKAIIRISRMFNMKTYCYTANPSRHTDIGNMGTEFLSIDELIHKSNIIVLCLPSNEETVGIISYDRVQEMKNDSIFISISRPELIDIQALLNKAYEYDSFYLGLDIDVLPLNLEKRDNVIITPHYAGVTVEARERQFIEVAENITSVINKW